MRTWSEAQRQPGGVLAAPHCGFIPATTRLGLQGDPGGWGGENTAQSLSRQAFFHPGCLLGERAPVEAVLGLFCSPGPGLCPGELLTFLPWSWMLTQGYFSDWSSCPGK